MPEGMKKLVVVDHRDKTMTVYPYDENVWESPEDYMTEDEELVIHSDCSWIVVDALTIKIV
jgi:hypothetical protein